MSHRDLPDNPAERALFNRLVVLGNPPSEVFKLIDDFAHELAEKIRAWAAVEVGGEIEEIYGYAADLIDPEVDDEAGPVRPDEEPTT
ncbi:hypothetical protein [Streptomyces stelliscabiei]|uniref:hypothetical protein n=1 Tax=Streptomyces stelliscabiei TaxID=146820 RepID=UPI0029A98C6E|nr:hypothetical protein [Streptomyces stelliscabiei]MDX2550142.1 hypothetical protein [Streptomyces stelliscabiei]